MKHKNKQKKYTVTQGQKKDHNEPKQPNKTQDEREEKLIKQKKT